MNILYYLVFSLWYALSLLPMRVLYVLSDFFYLLSYRVIKYRKAVIRKNLRNSFPQKSDVELKEIERKFYHYFCDYIVETIKLMTISKKNIRKRMRFEGMEEFNKVLDSGVSTAVFLGHYGNWEWITSLQLWVSPSVQCTQIYHPLENAVFERLFLYIRNRLGSLCITMNESLRRIVGYRQKGQTIVVGYIADQVPLWQNIHHWLDFMHQDTPVFTGAERITRTAKQAPFYGEVRRERRGRYVCRMIAIKPQANDSEWPVTDKYFELLEQSINTQPELWLWSHNRWKRTREDFNKLFKVVNGKVVRREKIK